MPTILSIPLSKIHPNPNEPRKFIRPGAIDACAASMKAVGQKTPLKLRKLPDGNYELIGGQIRIAAAQKLGLEALDAIILDITPEQAFLEAVLDNRDEEMTWLDLYQSIEALMSQPPKMNQQEVADRLEVDQATISRANKVLKALNKTAREEIYAQCIKSPGYIFSLRSMLALSELGDQDLVEKALKVVLDRQMTEPEVKRLVNWVKKGKSPESFPETHSTGSGREGQNAGKEAGERDIDPNDPYGNLWKDVPEGYKITFKPDGYVISRKVKHSVGPLSVYGDMAWTRALEQRLNPQANLTNPFDEALPGLLERCTQDALTEKAREDEKAKQAEQQKADKLAAKQARQAQWQKAREEREKAKTAKKAAKEQDRQAKKAAREQLLAQKKADKEAAKQVKLAQRQKVKEEREKKATGVLTDEDRLKKQQARMEEKKRNAGEEAEKSRAQLKGMLEQKVGPGQVSEIVYGLYLAGKGAEAARMVRWMLDKTAPGEAKGFIRALGSLSGKIWRLENPGVKRVSKVKAAEPPTANDVMDASAPKPRILPPLGTNETATVDQTPGSSPEKQEVVPPIDSKQDGSSQAKDGSKTTKDYIKDTVEEFGKSAAKQVGKDIINQIFKFKF